MKQLLYNATIVNGGKRFVGYLIIDGDKIAHIAEGMPCDEIFTQVHHSVDFEKDLLLPGVIDTHVHFRDGGNGSPKGDIASESRAAVAGGVTSFFDMPNTAPPTVSLEAWNTKMQRASSESVANYAFYLGATNCNMSELIDAPYSQIPGVKLFMGASTGNMLVDDNATIAALFRNLKCRIAVHAESQAVINESVSKLRTQFGDDTPVQYHQAARPRKACIESASLAIELAQKYNTLLSVLHLSTAEEAAMFPVAPVEGKRIVAETCPHYLIFGGEEDYLRLGARVKCNPAIKEKSDSKALLDALVQGRIDLVSTDHAPHLPSDKDGGALKAASGMPGVQFSLPVMLTLSDLNPKLTIERVVEVMAHNPAIVYGIENRGFLRVNYYADIVRVRPLKWTVADSDVVSRCGWTPYNGITLNYKVVDTWVNGSSENCKGMPLKFMRE